MKSFSHTWGGKEKKITERIIQQLSCLQNSHFFSSIKGQPHLFIK